MFTRLSDKLLANSISVIFIIATLFLVGSDVQAAIDLRGRILLQVETEGRAWYVNPINNERYYLGRPDDAFSLMRSLGLGVSNQDINNFVSSRAPERLKGRILLQVQDKGQAYYVDPLDLKLYYLGRPADAFNLMRAKALGITNANLDLIKIAAESPAVDGISLTTSNNSVITSVNDLDIYPAYFNFKYKNIAYSVTHNLSKSIYQTYSNSPKVYTYRSDNPPTDFREAFYSLFVSAKENDNSIYELIFKLRALANQQDFTEDEFVDFVLAFVQFIPYADGKVTAVSATNINPYFPYETLYLNEGVCSDKTFLALMFMRELGYGAAILDFPDINHSALGLACPQEYSLNNSGYCYVETTNYFPPGVIPQSIAGGQAQLSEGVTDFFDSQKLGKIEIYQRSQGRIYGGLPSLFDKIKNLQNLHQKLTTEKISLTEIVNNLDKQEAELVILKQQLDNFYANNQIKEYNQTVVSYNNLANIYNDNLNIYSDKLEQYNLLVTQVNSLTAEFYQK